MPAIQNLVSHLTMPAEPLTPATERLRNVLLDPNIPDNFGVRQAIRMLREQGFGQLPPIQVNTSAHPDRMQAASPQIRAYVQQGDPRIYLNDWSSMYQGANDNKPSALHDLASVLAHEAHHVTNGPAEGPAYDEQLRVLQLLGAAPDLVQATMRARMAGVTGSQK